MNVDCTALRLDAVIGRALHAVAWLVVPMVLLLLAQWPLRDVIQAYSAQANDAAQVLFALFMAGAVAAATRRNSHLRTHTPAVGQRVAVPALEALRSAVLIVWAGLVLMASAAGMRQSLLGLERFPETDNPGYFVIRIALWLLVLGVALQTLLRLRRGVA